MAAFVARSISTVGAAQIEAHLADCATCRQLAFAMVSDRSAALSDAGPPPARQIGRFEVESAIGRGATGEVHRAFDPELGRHVAIKVLREHARLGTDGEVRLRREALALAKLNHPHVVAVYEAGRHGRTAYVAMELVQGVTLDVWLSTPRTQRAVIALMIDAGRGLAAAHAVGLVHRDVKPHNVLVSEAGVAKVGDFGLARVQRDRPTTEPADVITSQDLAITLTLTGALVGTPAYMAPEQLRGEVATEASDQFSFCVTLYEALCGVRPFTGHTVAELLAAMARGATFPGTPRVPARIRRAVLRGLAVAPAERFATMSDLLAALSRPSGARRIAVAAAVAASLGITVAITGAALMERPDPCGAGEARAQQAFGPARQHAILAALAGGAPETRIAAQTAVQLLADHGRRWEAARVASCRATTQGRQSPQLGDRQRACLERNLQQVDDLGLVLATSAQPAVRERAAGAVESIPDPDACTQAGALFTSHPPPPPDQVAAVSRLETRIDRMVNLEATGQADLASREIDAVVASARATRYAPIVARALMAQASVYDAVERFTEVEPVLDDAAREAATAADDELVARAWTMRVNVMTQVGRIEEARRWVSAAEAAVRRAGNPAEVSALLHTYVGSLLSTAGEHGRARTEMELALALRERAGANRKIAIARAHNSLGVVLLRQGNYEAAEQHILTALSLFRDAYGELHPLVVSALMNLSALHGMTAPERAIAYGEQALPLAEKLYGTTGVKVAGLLDNLGIAYRAFGQPEKAVRLHRRAYEIRAARLGPKHPQVAVALGNLGTALLDLEDYRAAIDADRRAVDILTATAGPHDHEVAIARSGLGDALERAGDVDGAIAAYRDALAVYEPGDDAGGEDAAHVRTDLARLLIVTGKTAEARALFERAHRTLVGSTTEHRGYFLVALAGLTICDVRDRAVDRGRLAKLEQALAAEHAPAPEIVAYVAYARAQAYAALGDRAQARTLAATSRDGFANARMTWHRGQVERWLLALH